MRILHFSDVHIGVENYGRIDPDTGLSTRLVDFLDTFDEVVDYALDTRVDLVLFCGDAYKSRDPTQTHQREFARRIARLSSGSIPVFLLTGNHDMPFTDGRATSLDIFRTLGVSGVYIGDKLETHVVPTAAGPLQIVALPWIRRSEFLTRKDTQGLTPEEINEAIQAALTESIRSNAEALDPALPAILAGHVTVSDAKTGSEQSMMLGRDHVLLRSNIALPQFDYVALGHIHRRQVIGHNPDVVYAGSLQRIDFGEEKDDKGFYVIDLDPALPSGLRVTRVEFQQVDARRFLTISVEIHPGDPDPTATVIQAIDGAYFDDAIVRVIIKVSAEMQGHLRDADIRGALGEANYVASISREVVEQAPTRLGHASPQDMEPREALRLYMTSRNVPPERAKVLLQHADSLMEDEDSS